MHRFYAPGFALGQDVLLPEDEAQHLAKVMRLKEGDLVAVFDGRGHEAAARVQAIAGRRVTVKAMEKRVPAPEPAIALTLAQAMLKSDKMDHVIRDAVMLGVTAIQPLTSARTEVPLPAADARKARWDRTVISSVKQCGRAVVPRVHPGRALSDVVKGLGDELGLMFVEPGQADATPAGRTFGCAALHSLETRVPAKATILIGPEGGWDPQEICDAEAAGVMLVTMGPRVLRADAAASVAIAVLQYVWKDC
jgi:16S rRNA (uracil1498-N3)-methyltransferase